MLILRRKTLTDNTVAALIRQFPQLALSGSRSVFMDIINLFATMNTESKNRQVVYDAVRVK